MTKKYNAKVNSNYKHFFYIYKWHFITISQIYDLFSTPYNFVSFASLLLLSVVLAVFGLHQGAPKWRRKCEEEHGTLLFLIIIYLMCKFKQIMVGSLQKWSMHMHKNLFTLEVTYFLQKKSALHHRICWCVFV
jgi:hypothetical protein